MRTVHGMPPNYDKIKAVLPVEGTWAVFCYGDTIYAPRGQYIDKHYFAHEAIHSTQQGDSPETWWTRYLTDTAFRFEQELEAYRTQYRYICKHEQSRNERNYWLMRFAQDLTSPMYQVEGSLLEIKKLIEKV